jgi:hypothetical protein
MISVNQYIQTGFSNGDAEKLLSVIQPFVAKKEKIVLDFYNIKFFTTLFFNNALAKYLVELGPEEYARLFEVKNLSEIGETTYQHSLDNAKEYYAMSQEQRIAQINILADPEAEYGEE